MCIKTYQGNFGNIQTFGEEKVLNFVALHRKVQFWTLREWMEEGKRLGSIEISPSCKLFTAETLESTVRATKIESHVAIKIKQLHRNREPVRTNHKKSGTLMKCRPARN